MKLNFHIVFANQTGEIDGVPIILTGSARDESNYNFCPFRDKYAKNLLYLRNIYGDGELLVGVANSVHQI